MYSILGFYKFKKINSLKKNKILLQCIFEKLNIRGTLIISKEGVNGSISGQKKNINIIKKKIKNLFKFKEFDSENSSINKFQPFHKYKIKIKKEVVPMGIRISQTNKNKNLVTPKKWNSLLKDKKTLVLDARKPFEYEVGSFKGAINPNTKHFRDFPKFLKKINKNKPVAMFCTGGIRCEKASVFLKEKGFKKVFQLKGGILNYLKSINKKDSLWKGECFVFDNRVSVRHKLLIGSYSICSGCRKPVSPQDKKSKMYEEGVSCPKCKNILSNSQVSRFRMRQKQIDFARSSGKKYFFQKEF